MQSIGTETPVALWVLYASNVQGEPSKSQLGLSRCDWLQSSCDPLPQSAMIHNPQMEHFRYNPYSKVLTREHYDTPKMHNIRKWDKDWYSLVLFFSVLAGEEGTIRFWASGAEGEGIVEILKHHVLLRSIWYVAGTWFFPRFSVALTSR